MRRNNEVLNGETEAAFAVTALLANILILIVAANTLWLVQVLFTNLFSLEAAAWRWAGI